MMGHVRGKMTLGGNRASWWGGVRGQSTDWLEGRGGMGDVEGGGG